MVRSFVEFTRPRYFEALRVNSSSADNTDNVRRALSIEPKQAKQATPKYAEFTSTLKGDAALAAKVLEKNVHDRTLHREASVRLCRQLRENDLLELPGCADPVAAKARAFCAKVL